jgi:hypothetical protein
MNIDICENLALKSQRGSIHFGGMYGMVPLFDLSIKCIETLLCPYCDLE